MAYTGAAAQFYVVIWRSYGGSGEVTDKDMEGVSQLQYCDRADRDRVGGMWYTSNNMISLSWIAGHARIEKSIRLWLLGKYPLIHKL